MPKSKPAYAPEFRQQLIDLVRAGRTPAELSREFGVTAQSISTWIAKASSTGSSAAPIPNALSASERDESSRLRRENKQLRVERDTLSKATAWFANESTSGSKKSSDSRE